MVFVSLTYKIHIRYWKLVIKLLISKLFKPISIIINYQREEIMSPSSALFFEHVSLYFGYFNKLGSEKSSASKFVTGAQTYPNPWCGEVSVTDTWMA